VLVIIPTYNEVDSLEGVVGGLRSAAPTVDVLVVDDASPDGTGALADRLALDDERVTVLHRPGKDGLARAYGAGFARARELDYDIVVEMDADGSHPAQTLPTMLDRLVSGGDALGLVIGSRWVPGGAVENWPLYRRFLSQAGNHYARLMLRLPVRDATAGFRAYRAPVLDAVTTPEIGSQGYCFQIDLALRVHDRGFAIAEVPIVFREREAGVSKMSKAIVVEAMVRVTVWGVKRWFSGASVPARQSAIR
jgi:dolichol-phosphate mannosyltransferase